MAIFTTYVAKFFDARGDFVGTKNFDRTEKSFHYKEGRYLIDLRASEEDINVFPFPFGWIWEKRKFFYNIKFPEPYTLNVRNDDVTPKFDPKVFDAIFENKLAEEVNKVDKGLFSWLNLKTLLIIVVIGIIAYYILSGHKIF